MKKYIILLIAAYICSQCDTPIDLDLDQHEAQYVIEGLITNEESRHSVRISRTVAFNDPAPAQRVRNAVVVVQDELGNRYDFVEDSAGLYRSLTPFAGQVGRSYTLDVAVDDRHFTATERLPAPATIDSIVYLVNEEEQADPDREDHFYEVLLFMNEPQATEDYYLAKFYRNGELENDEGESVFYFDDRILSDRINGLAAPYFYAAEDHFRFELYNLSRKAHRYYFELEGNINSDGGIFSGTPANILTNLEGGAIGYFLVAGLVSAETTIRE
jgi:hypothetical protein